jgi:hypothetical protein
VPWSATASPLWFTKGAAAGGQKVGATIGIVIATVAAVAIIGAVAIVLIKKNAPGPELGDNNLDEAEDVEAAPEKNVPDEKQASDQPSSGDDDGSEDYSVSKVDIE